MARAPSLSKVPRLSVAQPRAQVAQSSRAVVTELAAARPRNAEELPCECGDARCRSVVPASSEAHRGGPERVIVDPLHVGFGTIVRIADRFVVIDTAGQSLARRWRAASRAVVAAGAPFGEGA